MDGGGPGIGGRRGTRPRTEMEIAAHLPALRRYARSLTRDPVQAEDLVQETALRALRRLEQFRPGTDLRAWLFAILRNLHHSCRRRRAVRDETPLSDAPAPAVDPGAEARLGFSDLVRDFACLTHGQRLALILVGGLGHSYEEAAAIAGCPVGTIRSRVKRGRERLRARQAAD